MPVVQVALEQLLQHERHRRQRSDERDPAVPARWLAVSEGAQDGSDEAEHDERDAEREQRAARSPDSRARSRRAGAHARARPVPQPGSRPNDRRTSRSPRAAPRSASSADASCTHGGTRHLRCACGRRRDVRRRAGGKRGVRARLPARGARARRGKGLAVLTCMDSRIEPLAMLGLEPGDAKILRNAGARVTDDVLRTFVLAATCSASTASMIVAHTSAAWRPPRRTTSTRRCATPAARHAQPRLPGLERPGGALRDDVQRVRSWPYLTTFTSAASSTTSTPGASRASADRPAGARPRRPPPDPSQPCSQLPDSSSVFRSLRIHVQPPPPCASGATLDDLRRVFGAPSSSWVTVRSSRRRLPRRSPR